jgi:hypothetical protein
MNAKDARQLTDQQIRNELLGPTMETVYKKIKAKIDQGHYSLSHPFNGHTVEYHIRKACLDKLREEGYDVIHHKGCGQREPAYDEISWQNA